MSAKRMIFVSYHRGDDLGFYDRFSAAFSDIYEVVRDTFPDDGSRIESPEEAVLRLRKDLIAGACCAVVLCGAKTPWDNHVDWAIKAALDERRGLIAVNLPTSRADSHDRVQVPRRLHENIASGYAMWLEWTKLLEAPLAMGAYIAVAGRNARKPDLIRNDAPPGPL